jgi:NCS1 family nucleobase:cation symporter-1
MTEFLGCTMAVASSVVYGKVEWNPLVVINQFDYRAGKFFAGALFVFFNIMTNVTGNSIPLANDLTGLFPKYINIRRGQFICAVVSFATCPWKIQARAENFLAFLGAYTLFLGATTGIMMVDYFMIRHGYGINIAHLFKRRGSIYWYTYGVNWRAFLAWFIALAPLLPGMVSSMGVSVRNESVLDMYSWNYVLVVAFSGTLYWILGAIWPFPVESGDANDIGAIYRIEGVEPSGVVALDVAELGEKGSRRDSEKTALQSSAITHGPDVSV